LHAVVGGTLPSDVKRRAVETLGRVGTKESLDALRKLEGDSDKNLAPAASAAVKAIETRATTDPALKKDK
jgi:HEAT repeat protein